MDFYNETKDKIEQASTEEELIAIFKEYDEIEGNKIRRIKELKDLIAKKNNEESELEIELSNIDDHYRMFRPIKDIVAVKIFDLSQGT